MAGGHPNLYLYCFNRPLIWKDPSGLQIVFFTHGSNSSPSIFTNDRSLVRAVKTTLQTKGHVVLGWDSSFSAGGANPAHIESEGRRLAECIRNAKKKHPNELIIVYGHSNGGNIAGAAARAGAPIDLKIRVGSPYYSGMIEVPRGTIVFDFYDPRDPVQFGAAYLFGNAMEARQVDRVFGNSSEWDGWQRFRIESGCRSNEIHSVYLRSVAAWTKWMLSPVAEWRSRR